MSFRRAASNVQKLLLCHPLAIDGDAAGFAFGGYVCNERRLARRSRNAGGEDKPNQECSGLHRGMMSRIWPHQSGSFPPIADIRSARQTASMNTTSEQFVERKVNVDRREVSCRFYRPEPDGSSFRCRFEIDWPEGCRSKVAGGVDEVQALLLAMVHAHTDLLAARENDGREVSWLHERTLGLPIAKTIRDWDPDNPF